MSICVFLCVVCWVCVLCFGVGGWLSCGCVCGVVVDDVDVVDVVDVVVVVVLGVVFGVQGMLLRLVVFRCEGVCGFCDGGVGF